MNEIKIEKGIPQPPTKGGKKKYPFGEMAIGDSFLVPTDNNGAGSVRCAASYYGSRHPGFKFVVRMVDGGCRCWRVEMPPNETKM